MINYAQLVRLGIIALVAAALPSGSGEFPPPAATARYVIQAATPAEAERIALSVEARITHRLDVIRAVGAELTSAQRDTLQAQYPGLRVYQDVGVSTASGGDTQTVRDEFELQSYGNNDGTAAWASDWAETNDGGGPTGGNILIAAKGELSIRRPARGIARSVYLPTGSTAVLSFEHKRVRLYSPDHYVAVQVSSDGGASWTEVGRVQGPDVDSQMVPYSVDISSFAAPDTMIRFYSSDAMDGNTRIWFDNVQVEYRGDVVSTEVEKNVLDTFSVQSYASNDGSAQWAGDWTESGDDGDPLAGKVRVKTNQVLVLSNVSRGIERAADLSDASSAELSFNYRRKALDNASDFIVLEVSADGGSSWTELDTFAGPNNDQDFVTASYDISAYAAAQTVIRFWTAPSGMNDYDNLLVDNVKISYSSAPDSHYPTLIGADQLHQLGIDGAGVTVAVIDSGYFSHEKLDLNADGAPRVLAQYDARTDQVVNATQDTDENGHGVHVSSMIVSSNTSTAGKFNGVAPGASLVSVKALDHDGNGSYLDVIRGIDWVVANKDSLGIRVLNLSLSADPRSHYWEDPLNQAVMAAWQAGIVVVASAGNKGPDAMTIGVPGNVPYVITVGAMSDSYTPADGSDDVLASFSSAGPTYEGFVKPELVAPGGHMLGLMPLNASIALDYPQFQKAASFFAMSGTSQATAVVSGSVALMLQADPSLTPDDVKCRLLASARPAVDPNGALAYSVFQQGAGQVNAYDAVHSTATGCANRGLDVDQDLDGRAHFGGRASQDENGDFYLMGLDGYMWTDGYFWTDGYVWTDGYIWTDGYLWADAYLWTDGVLTSLGYLWTDGYIWTDGYVWTDGYIWTDGYLWADGLTESMSTNVWVDQE